MNIGLIIKGFIVGVGKIIPGVSGSMLAISMGIYEKILDSIGHFFRDIRENIFFLGNFCLGVLLAILLFSSVIYWSLEHFYFYVMLLFIGLILGTMPSVVKVVKGKFSWYRFVLFSLSFLLVFLLMFVQNNNVSDVQNSFFHYIIIGFIDAVTMIVPGISGTAVLMILGYYDLFIHLFVDFFWGPIFYFGIGMGVGGLLISRIMGYLLSNYKISTYCVILGFSLSSIFVLLVKTLQSSYTVFSLVIGFVLMVVGYYLSSSLNKD